MSPKSLSLMFGLCPLLVSGGLQAQEAKSRFHWPEGKRVAVSFSFDDARASQVDAGLPLFDKHGAKATFYVNPRSVGRRLEGWKKAAANGHEIGDHSNSHPCTGNFAFSQKNALEEYSVQRLEKDLDESAAQIEKMLGVKPVTFAYPCGQKFVGRGLETKSYVPVIAKRYLAGRGFRDESTNDPAVCDLAQILGIESDGLTFEQMKKLATGAAAQDRWLVFAGHEIGKPGSQTTLAADLDLFLQYAKEPSNGIWLDTVKAVANYVQAQRGKQ